MGRAKELADLGSVVTVDNGNVGIGTSSPAGVVGTGRTLVVSNTGHATISVQAIDGGNDRNATIEILSSGNGGSTADLVFGDTDTTPGTPSPLRFLSRHSGTTTERMRIDSSGNLLVNLTSSLPGNPIEAVQTVGRVFGGQNFCYLAAGATSGVNAFALRTYSTTTSSVVGSIQFSSTATSYNTSSDYRLKHDIQPMTGALAKVALLKPRTYKWNVDDSDGEGFIAHELQEVCPSAVSGTKDAVDAEGNPIYQGIDTSFLVATLTAAIQEQQAIIQSLTARIEALETEST